MISNPDFSNQPICPREAAKMFGLTLGELEEAFQEQQELKRLEAIAEAQEAKRQKTEEVAKSHSNELAIFAKWCRERQATIIAQLEEESSSS